MNSDRQRMLSDYYGTASTSGHASVATRAKAQLVTNSDIKTMRNIDNNIREMHQNQEMIRKGFGAPIRRTK